jgi:hypothetical protein
MSAPVAVPTTAHRSWAGQVVEENHGGASAIARADLGHRAHGCFWGNESARPFFRDLISVLEFLMAALRKVYETVD